MNTKKADSGQTSDAARDKESRPSLDTVDGLVVLCGHDVGCPFARQANGTCTATVDCPYMKHNKY